MLLCIASERFHQWWSCLLSIVWLSWMAYSYGISRTFSLIHVMCHGIIEGFGSLWISRLPLSHHAWYSAVTHDILLKREREREREKRLYTNSGQSGVPTNFFFPFYFKHQQTLFISYNSSSLFSLASVSFCVSSCNINAAASPHSL